MSFVSPDSGIAASIFLGLYTIYTLLCIKIVYHEGWRTIYTFFLAFGVFRLAGQLSGVAFASLGIDHWQWLIAYLVFSAEGYFVLILCTLYLTCKAQQEVHGTSWIKPTKGEVKIRQSKCTNRWKKRLAWFTYARVFHLLLIPANAIIIAGGTMLTSVNPQDINTSSKVHTSKALRTAGQAIFLLQTAIAISAAVFGAMFENLWHTVSIKAVFLAAPFVTVRGIFGVMSIYIKSMNYFDIGNYSKDGLTSKFVIYEYVLATTMEFIAGVIYVGTYYLERAKRGREGVDKEAASMKSNILSAGATESEITKGQRPE